MSKLYNIRPSEILGDELDNYTAYCFDLAIGYIIVELDAGKELFFKKEIKDTSSEDGHYSSFSKLYSKYE